MMKPFEMKPFEDFQKLGQTNVDAAMKVFGEWNKGWQAIASEMTDYTKRSFEDSSATFEKLVSSRSIEQVMEIQTTYAKRAYDEYMHQLTKIGGMYAELAKEAYRPVERALQNGRLSGPLRLSSIKQARHNSRAFFLSQSEPTCDRALQPARAECPPAVSGRLHVCRHRWTVAKIGIYGAVWRRVENRIE